MYAQLSIGAIDLLFCLSLHLLLLLMRAVIESLARQCWLEDVTNLTSLADRNGASNKA